MPDSRGGSWLPDEILAEVKRARDLRAKQNTPEGQVAADKELRQFDDAKLYQIAASATDDRDPSTMGEIEQYLRNGDYIGLEARLGKERAAKLQGLYSDALGQATQDLASDRSWGSVVPDALVTAGSGVINAGLGLEMAASGLFSPDFMAGSAKANQEFNRNVVDALSSDASLAHQRVKKARDASKEEEHAVQADLEAEAANKNDNNIVGTLAAWGKRVVYDFGTGVKHTVTDPTLLSNGIADTAASMAVAAGVSKGLSAIGEMTVKGLATGEARKAILKDAATTAGEQLSKETVEQYAHEIGKWATKELAPKINSASWMGANALTEGAGAYQQAAQEILRRDPQDLLKTSEGYRKRVDELTKQGIPLPLALDQAKNELARDAANSAALQTGITASGISHWLGEQGQTPLYLLKHPETAGKLIKEWAKETGSETVEEGLQGATGQLIANRALQNYVNPNQDILAGVGQQAGEGAALAGISTGLMKSSDLLRGTGMAAASGVKAASQFTNKRSEALRTEAEAQSEGTVANLDKRAAALEKTAAGVNFPDLISQIPEEAKSKAAGEAIQELVGSHLVQENPESLDVLPEELQATLSKINSRVEMVDKTAKLLTAEKDPEVRGQLANFLGDLLKPIQRFQERSEDLDAFADNPKAMEVINGFREVLGGIEQLPSVKTALDSNKETVVAAVKESAESEQAPALESDIQAAYKESDETYKTLKAVRVETEPAYAALQQAQSSSAKSGVIKGLEQAVQQANDKRKAATEKFDQANKKLDELLARKRAGEKATQRLVQAVTAQAKVDPTAIADSGVSPETVRTILTHGEGGGLTEGQRAALKGALELLEARKLIEDERLKKVAEQGAKASKSNGKNFLEDLKNRYLLKQKLSRSQQVSGDITVEQNALEAGKYSARQDADRVVAAMAGGNKGKAKAALQHMANLTQHMAYKVDAINRSAQDKTDPGGRKTYRQLQPDGETFLDSGSNPKDYKFKYAFLDIRKDYSIAHAQAVDAEMHLLHRITSGLAKAYPELEVKVPDEVRLLPHLRSVDPVSYSAKKAAEIKAAMERKAARKTEEKQAPKTEAEKVDALMEKAAPKAETQKLTPQQTRAADKKLMEDNGLVPNKRERAEQRQELKEQAEFEKAQQTKPVESKIEPKVEKKPAPKANRNEILNRVQKAFQNRKHESGAAIDPETGKTIAITQGDQKQFRFTGEQGKKIREHRNAVIVHNHPSGWAVLSPSDIALAMEVNAAEFRAVTADGSVSKITRPAGGWPVQSKTQLDQLQESLSEIRKSIGWTQDESQRATVIQQVAQAYNEYAEKSGQNWKVELEQNGKPVAIEAKPVVDPNLAPKEETSAEPVKTPEVTPEIETKAKIEKTADLYPNVRENFHRSFEIGKTKDGQLATRLLGKPGSLGIVRNAIESNETLQSHLGEKAELTHRLSQEVSSAYKTLLDVPANVGGLVLAWKQEWERRNRRQDKKGEHYVKAEQDIPERDPALQTIGGVMGFMMVNLQTFLDNKKWDGAMLGEHLKNGRTEPLLWPNGKVLNATETRPDGKIRYNDELLQQAALAGLQWALTAHQHQVVPKPDQVEESLATEEGLRFEGEIPDTKIQELSEGQSTLQAKRSLAGYIRRFWGLSEAKSTGIGLTEGIPEAIAAEVLQALNDAGLVKVKKVSLKDLGVNKTVDRYVAQDLGKDNPVYDYPDLLEKVIVTEPEPASFYGEVVPLVKPQILGTNLDTTDESKRARKNMQAVPFFLNGPMAEAVLPLEGDDERLLAVFGVKLSDNPDEKYNKNHLDTLKSRNNSVLNAAKEFRRIYGEMKSTAGKEGDVNQLAKRYQYAVIATNRIQMLGAYNPQAHKLMRELLMATWSQSLDLSGELKSPDYQYMMLAVAQALGEKIHKKTFDTNVQWAHEQINGKLAPAIDVLVNWFNGEETDSPLENFKLALDQVGVENTPLVTMALMEVARMKHLEQSNPEELKSFRTPLYLEADGMTNGPFNAVGLLTTGEFTAEWVRAANRGGFAVSSTPKTADQLANNPDLKGLDNYGASMVAAANEADQQLTRIQKQPKGTGKPVVEVANQLFTALKLLFPKDVNWTAEDLESGKWHLDLERGMGKNPITILIYGSGVPGIAGKITKKLTKAFYEKLSDLMQGKIDKDSPELKQLLIAMQSLAGQQVIHIKKSNQFVIDQDSKLSDLLARLQKEGPQAFTFTPTEIKQIEQNMLHLLVKPMEQGIRKTLGNSIFDSRDLLVEATKLTSNLGQLMYQKAIFDKIAEKIKAAQKAGLSPEDAKKQVHSEFLSRNELNQIWDDLAEVMPIVKSDGQQFLIAKKKLADFWLDPKNREEATFSYSTSLDGKMKTQPNVQVVSDSGVGGMPYLVIGMGDARMVRSVFEKAFEGVMQVFDGMNIPVDKIAKYGPRINEAALRAFQGNVFKAVGETFIRSFTHPSVLAALESNPKMAEALFYAVNPKWKEFGGTALTDQIDGVREQLNNAALEVEARRLTLAEFGVSMDQMSGTFKPYVRKGQRVMPEDATPEEQVKILNAVYRQHLETLQATAQGAKKAQAAEKPGRVAVQKALAGGQQHESGVRILTAEALRNLPFKLADLLTKSEREVLEQAVSSNAVNGVRLVAGTPEQIADYQDGNSLTSASQLSEKNLDKTIHGYYAPGEKTIYLVNPQIETLVHELVHASTYEAVRAYYDGKNLGENKKYIVDAIKRLERLMDVFLKGDFRFEPESREAQSLTSAQREIESHDRNTTEGKAMALNEFMAWTLANRELAESLESRSQSEKLVKSSVENQVRLLGENASREEKKSIRETLVENSRLARIVRAAYEAVRKIIWGDRKAPEYGSDILSQVRFNTAIISQIAPTIESQVREVSLMHAVLSGVENTRLEKLNDTFSTLVARHLNQTYSKTRLKELDSKSIPELVRPDEISTLALDVAQNVFPMTPEEQFTFKNMMFAFSSGAQIAPGAMAKAQEIFDRFMKGLHWEDFKTGQGDVLNDEAQARAKFEFIAGHTLAGVKDAQDRSTVLPSFLALAAVNEDFRALLGKKVLLDVEGKQPYVGIDSTLENLGIEVMERVGNALANIEGHPVSVQMALNQLTDGIVKNVLDTKTGLAAQIEGPANSVTRLINGQMVKALQKVAKKSLKAGENLRKYDSKLVQSLGSALEAIAVMTGEKEAVAVAESLLEQTDKNLKSREWLRDLLVDVTGRVPSQAEIYDMQKRVRAYIAQARQNYREKIPFVIESKFKQKPNKTQWDALYRFMGRYDLAALMDGRTTEEVLKLADDPNALRIEISRLEGLLGANSSPEQMAAYGRKIAQYVKFVQTGVRDGNLLTNAYAISELLGEPERRQGVSDDVIQTIDQLITLKLLEGAQDGDRQIFSDLLQHEKEGLSFTLSYLQGQRATEMEKALEGRAKYNHYKGVLPSESSQQGHIVVADDTEHARMIELGYTRVGTYKGSNIDVRSGGSKSYYSSPLSSLKATFAQGITQNVQKTAYGVHLQTGLSSEPNAGVITDPATVKRLGKLMAKEIAGQENLAPIYDANGSLVAFVRTLSPEQMAKLKQPQNLAKMIGQWRGRQMEEIWADDTNTELVKHLHDMWQKDLDKTRYVNVLDPNADPVIRDAVSLLPRSMRQMLEEKFGEGTFYVRRNLVNQVIGSRNASVGDLWTGNTRHSKEFQQMARNALVAFFGMDAYRKLVQAERNWQAVTASVRTNIVVRSISVPAANFVSGLYQLRGRGVAYSAIARGIPAKTREVEFYTKSFMRKVEIEAELFASKDITQTRKLEAELQSLLDSQKRLSIWPLIEAGELSTISEVGQTAEDLDLTNSTLIDRMTAAVDKLPPGLRDAARQGYMARDTAIFKAMQKWTQYSDFIMKSIYYDHLLKNEKELLSQTVGYEAKVNEFIGQGLSGPQANEQARVAMALGRITEEFNNYDVPTGRTRGYLENMGLLWFMNYKLRATKIALGMIRNNPFQALISMIGMSVMHLPGVDTPITGNVLARLFQGVLGFSIGPRMMLQPIAINPWLHVADMFWDSALSTPLH